MWFVGGGGEIGADGFGVVLDDAGLYALDDQDMFADLERRDVLLRDRHKIALGLAHDIFVAVGVLKFLADLIAGDAAKHRAAQRAKRGDRRVGDLRAGDAARGCAGCRGESCIHADRYLADADDDAGVDLAGLLDSGA